ncbi:MAG: GH3 auxin-responsive promoter family protein [Proteobacteria bacterium]|nr:GH3 auxin-responsive promoter family protein [Pseudomonadota bacterium]
MSVAVNAFARAVLSPLIRGVGGLLSVQVSRGLSGHAAEQERLRTLYGVTPDVPIRGYDDELRARARAIPNARLVRTSGSTNEPKEIAFTKGRLRSTKLAFAGATFRTAYALGTRRPILFALASLAHDDSFTAMMVTGRPSWFDLWVTPHRALTMPVFAPLSERYGVHALRLWAMVLSNPGWLYSTNPSTQAAYFHALAEDWDTHTAFLRDYMADPSQFASEIRWAASRIEEPGWQERARRVLDSEVALGPEEWMDVEVFLCWDGGNTRPFLNQVREWLPSARFVPMFSMSTETLETLSVYDGQEVHFPPIAPGVLCEFLPEDAEDLPENLLRSTELEVGKYYALVASDAYGLLRYQTEDVFLCKAIWRGLPDLRFARRRGLTWSYTGEKLTGAQVEMAYERLAEHFPMLARVQATTVPSQPEGAHLPGYRLLFAVPGGQPPDDAPSLDELATAYDKALGDINDEYASKRKSTRLSDPVAEWVDYDGLARALRNKDDEGSARGWDSQFKLLPLLRRPYEELAL